MLGSPCNSCCPQGCDGVQDGKLRTDPADEGTWVPSGTYDTGGRVSWSFVPHQESTPGNTWFFYGSEFTSGDGSPTDWGNPCNWYSAKLFSPPDNAQRIDENTGRVRLQVRLIRRATRLPDENAVVHIYTAVDTLAVGPVTVRTAYFWGRIQTRVDEGVSQNPALVPAQFLAGSELTATHPATGTTRAVVIRNESRILGTINGGADFGDLSFLHQTGVVNGGATFRSNTSNYAVVNGDTQFLDRSILLYSGIVNGNVELRGRGINNGTINGNADFYGESKNVGRNWVQVGQSALDLAGGGPGEVAGTATFYDAACSWRFEFIDGRTRATASATKRPICNGSAVSITNRCGCD